MLQMLRFWQLFFASSVLSIAVVANAFHMRKEFYPSVVYLAKSSPSLTILYIQALSMVWLLAKAFQKIFFGQLRAMEVEHLFERSWYAITETCLAFTVFRDDFSSSFVVSFVFLLFVKCFHWLAEDRVDLMERSPSLPNIFHIRMLALLITLTCVDAACVHYSVSAVMAKGASVQLVFAFEYAVLYSVVFMVAAKYTLHSLDQRRTLGWDRKVVWLLYAELATSFIRLLLYTAFISLMLSMKVFALFAIRPTYMAVRSFTKAATDVIRSRIAIRNLNTLFPDATVQDLQSITDTVCIICREDMLTNGQLSGVVSPLCKKLPCSHMFHAGCLRSWFQRQQTCPTCRADVVNIRANRNASNGGQRANEESNAQNRNNVPPPAGSTPAATGPSGPTATLGTPQYSMLPSIGLIPPPPFFLPFYAPTAPPMMNPGSQSTNTQSVAELRAREAALLSEMETRIKCLESVRLCLDASVTQLKTYVELANTHRNAGESTSQPTTGS